MKSLLRHLPLLMLTAALLLGAASCGDEPQGKHHGDRVDPTPADTSGHSDTTSHHHTSDTTGTPGSDTTTTPLTIAIQAERDFGYMGEALHLHAVTSIPATVTWRSTRPAAATVDGDGMVTFSNVIHDDTTLIIATAGTVSDTLALANRCWKVAAWDGNAWAAPAYFTVHRGDTVALTIVGSSGATINDHGFNAAACQWSASCRNADMDAIATLIASPSSESGWRQIWAIADSAPTGAIFTILAGYHDSASALVCTVMP